MTFPRPSAWLLLTASSIPRMAFADDGFAEPPEQQPLVASHGFESRAHDGFEDAQYPPPAQGSSVRVNVGPTLRIAEPGTDGGLYVALDVGARAAGVRASGAWVRTDAELGVSQYTGELWIDFGVGTELHPVIGAGAGIARIESRNDAGEQETSTLGVGVLRGTIDYVLPVAGVDARVGLDAIGCVPATPGGNSADAGPWLMAAAHVGVGF